jgi:hypothetical protein
MKYVRTFIFIIYFIVYGYSAHKTSVAPDETIWGYICVFVFAILFIWGTSLFTQNSEKKSEED